MALKLSLLLPPQHHIASFVAFVISNHLVYFLSSLPGVTGSKRAGVLSFVLPPVIPALRRAPGIEGLLRYSDEWKLLSQGRGYKNRTRMFG